MNDSYLVYHISLFNVIPFLFQQIFSIAQYVFGTCYLKMDKNNLQNFLNLLPYNIHFIDDISTSIFMAQRLYIIWGELQRETSRFRSWIGNLKGMLATALVQKWGAWETQWKDLGVGGVWLLNRSSSCYHLHAYHCLTVEKDLA